MLRFPRAALLCGLLFPILPAALAQPLPGSPHTDTGELGGSRFRVDVPEHWNGSLVLAAHGYLPAGAPLPDSWPRYEYTSLLLDRGYAVASAGYRRQGWALAEAVPDTEALRRWFVERYGRPERTYMIGSSMGGLVTVASQESGAGNYDGALALCGAVAPASEGARDRLLASLVAFDYFFPDALTGAPLDLSSAEAPADLSEARLERALAGRPDQAELLARRFGIRREDLAGNLRFYYVMLHELVARSGGFPIDNREVAYAGFGDDAAFNRGVRRYAADPRAAEYLRLNYTPSGRVARPLMLLETSYDPIVPAQAVERYLELASAAGSSPQVLSRQVPGEGHCRFSADQVGAAFDTLVQWVGSGQRPEEPAGTSVAGGAGGSQPATVSAQPGPTAGGR